MPRPGPNDGPASRDPLDVIKTTITVAGFVGAVLIGVYGYRKQRLVEGDARRADAEQLAQRYTTAAGQLGHEKAAVRLIRLIRDHLRDPNAPTTWCGRDLDFTNATFDGGDFTGVKFTGDKVSFDHAKFTGGNVSFDDAKFATGRHITWGPFEPPATWSALPEWEPLQKKPPL